MSLREAKFVAGAASLDGVPRGPQPHVAFIGPSNVGKSSLLNLLVGQKALARVSRTPGRTQQLNFFLVDDAFFLVDLPGYGFAKAPASVKQDFQALTERYLATAKQLRLLVVLLDSRRDPSERDVALLEWLREQAVPHVIVLTKADKLSRAQLGKRAQAAGAVLCDALGCDAIELMPVSAVSGLGRRELVRVIEAAVEGKQPVGEQGIHPGPRPDLS